MSKRFTETTKWDDPWYHDLPPEAKLLWQWLTDKCDQSGVVDVSFSIASFQIGMKVEASTLEALGGRIAKLPSGKWRIVKFLEFQYGSLSDTCPAHKPVFRAMKANGIQYPIDRVSNTLQEEEKDKEEETKRKDSAGRTAPTEVEIVAYAESCAQVIIPKDCALRWMTDRETADWMRPKGLHMLPVLPNWQADLRGYAQDWNKREQEREAKNGAKTVRAGMVDKAGTVWTTT